MAIKQLDDFDFGFTAVGEDELKAMERQLQQQVEDKDTELENISKTYQEKLSALYKMVMPLLNNLAKDSEKDYIYWPGRQKKMSDFIKKVEALVNDR